MSSAVFYSSKKSFRSSSSAAHQRKIVVPLASYHIFVAFADGVWALFDAIKNNIVKEGKIEGDASKHLSLFNSPCALTNDCIVFVNCDKFKMYSLNPHTGEIDPKWQLDVPTVEALPEADRSVDTKVEKYYTGLHVHVLRKSQHIAVVDRKENTQGFLDYFITVFNYKTKERVAQVTHNAQGKSMKFKNGNDTNTLILWPESQSETLSFYILNIEQPAQGLQSVTVQIKMDCVLMDVFPWDDDSIVFFGNPDEGGVPLQLVYNFGTKEVKRTEMKCNFEDRPTLLNNALSVESKQKRVLLKEISSGPNIVIWNSSLNRVEFSRKQDKLRDCTACHDGTYLVEFERNGKLAKDPVVLVVNRLVSKKMFILHFLKHANVNGKAFKDVHASAAILKDIAGMM